MNTIARLLIPWSIRSPLPSLLIPLLYTLTLVMGATAIAQTQYYVSPTGSDDNPGSETLPWKTFQKSAQSATPGSTVFLKSGVYSEKVSIDISGSPEAGYITFSNAPGETVIIDGTGSPEDQIILIKNRRYIRICGLILRNNLHMEFGTGVWIMGYGDHIEILKNTIHDMRAAPGGGDAMAISVYGTHPTLPLSHIVLDSNHVFGCEPGHSEAVTFNGNVDTFFVRGNIIHDVDNIGIDMIGGEGTCPTPGNDAARNGICAGNTVYHARSGYGGGYAAGIYVDGGNAIIIERNTVYECDLGIEIGCENHGRISSGIVVRNNRIFRNDKAGLGFGGYNYPATGMVTGSFFLNNTLVHNDLLAMGTGELWIQYAEGCVVRNNIFFASAQNRLMTTTVGTGAGNSIDFNIWYGPGGDGGITVDWDGSVFSSFDSYRRATGQDASSLFDDPEFISTGMDLPDLHLGSSSPAIDAGDPVFVPSPGESDFDGGARVLNGRVDAGAFEYNGFPPRPPELLGMSGPPSQPFLAWKAVTTADRYHLQLSRTPLFDDVVYQDSTLTEAVHQTAELPDSTLLYWRVRGMADTLRGEWSAMWSFSTTGGNTEIPIMHRWNIISLPVAAADAPRQRIFPSATAGGYRFDGMAYADADSIDAGSGYWFKFLGNQIVGLSGTPLTIDTISVAPGWNLIGSLSSPMPVASIVSLPPSIVTSPLYGYDGGYTECDTLQPGRGYWLRSDTNAVVILSSESAPYPSGRIIVRPVSDLPPAPPGDRAGFPQVEQRTRSSAMLAAYPNPFNASTTLSVRIPAQSHVHVEIYSGLGQRTATLIDDMLPAGEHRFRWQAEDRSSGVYFYRISVGTTTQAGKLLLLR